MRNPYGNVAAPADGYIWDACLRAGVSVRSYGEFVLDPRPVRREEPDRRAMNTESAPVLSRPRYRDSKAHPSFLPSLRSLDPR